MAEDKTDESPARADDLPLTPRNANDLFFRRYFGNPDAARGFLEAVIAPELSREIDWGTCPLELISGTFIDPRLKDNASDLFWRIQLREDTEVYTYFLWDHQTRPDR